ncbi:putative hydrolase or acyltransferase of alpha/beta superfamily [Rivularia sp. PCC 7116]|uniref:alpha/beta fold hydrolase n=1 Tax=Rivularia sp. PCC 7116 TaxID=373994 RepID=UPI00029F210F|nr:alpha/beta hydrolase [Rivularia sp. PCC 7116]AFY57650.1 putative hydrolase or acyltransferase of alpha/beta superfamily [Rivularia sp. PCC 7116]
MPLPINYLILIATTIYQLIATWIEDKQSPPGQLIDVGGYKLHLYTMGKVSPTVILDHSLGGMEGYLLIEEIAKIARVCIYDRAGYGWSEKSPHQRSSEQIVKELDTLLNNAGIEPPYILVGDSFGSYNVRLYAHKYPEKVIGMVLTDGLHETGMLDMSFSLTVLKLFFASGFLMSILGSILGIIRLLKNIKAFEFLKPELRKFSPDNLNSIKRSFCRAKHWITMTQEILTLNISARQVSKANQFGDLPIVSIKAGSFFKPSIWTFALPLKAANQLREKIHAELLQLSSNCIQLQAPKSDHFVWVDSPEVILNAIEIILNKVGYNNQ